jgi:hypothetical protein
VLIVKFGEVMMDSSTSLLYLGMQVELIVERVDIKIDYFIRQMLHDMELRVQQSPGTKYTFKVDESTELLEEAQCKVWALRYTNV